MTRVLLIRHGQAAFGSADYDQLSPLGREQSDRVGAHLAALRLRPDAVYSGTLQRQRLTAELALRHFAEGVVPPLQLNPAFNEYPAASLFAAYLAQVRRREPSLAALGEGLVRDRRAFQRAFEGVMQCWLADPAPPPDVPESWAGFQDRIRAALEEIVRDFGPRETVHVYTSGGVIAVGVALALALSAQRTVALNWRVYNGSITELHYGRRGWSLMGFNAVDHFRLQESERLLTFR